MINSGEISRWRALLAKRNDRLAADFGFLSSDSRDSGYLPPKPSGELESGFVCIAIPNFAGRYLAR
ncbi:MAG: hypothetical protein DMF25_10645 [Verrucomicrobia bacterium]|nr:MAG: hypothetical protein DMF25_10645 [Verrucomicrobiota bacterium]